MLNDCLEWKNASSFILACYKGLGPSTTQLKWEIMPMINYSFLKLCAHTVQCQGSFESC